MSDTGPTSPTTSSPDKPGTFGLDEKLKVEWGEFVRLWIWARSAPAKDDEV